MGMLETRKGLIFSILFTYRIKSWPHIPHHFNNTINSNILEAITAVYVYERVFVKKNKKLIHVIAKHTCKS